MSQGGFVSRELLGEKLETLRQAGTHHGADVHGYRYSAEMVAALERQPRCKPAQVYAACMQPTELRCWLQSPTDSAKQVHSKLLECLSERQWVLEDEKEMSLARTPAS